MTTFFLEIYDQIYFYVTSANFGAVLIILKLTSYIISLTLAILIAILLKRSDATWWVKERAYAAQISYGQTEDQRWQKILEKLKKGDEANLKLAVIEADILLDDIFKRMGLPGKSMDERLGQITQAEIKSVDRIWEAHKIRDRIIDNSNVKISFAEAERAVGDIETALKELEYLQ